MLTMVIFNSITLSGTKAWIVITVTPSLHYGSPSPLTSWVKYNSRNWRKYNIQKPFKEWYNCQPNMMLILSSKTARLLMNVFKALTVSTFTWESLFKLLNPDKMEWLLGFVVPASYVSSKCIACKQHYCKHVLKEKEETTDSKHKKDAQQGRSQYEANRGTCVSHFFSSSVIFSSRAP